ncbi:MAG TPA: hypothetical protein VMZ30_05750 [Pyrinomonadaceae bacterium]|nr:hypothetical protein [Pyrinomonadaceae bacterium]
MMHVSLAIVCLFVLVASGSSVVRTSGTPNQNDEISESQENCPRIHVSCPAEVTKGEPIIFTASVSGGNPNIVPVFSWEVSAGLIVHGQGTSSIKVDMTNFGVQSPTGTVTISGFDSACARTASCSIPPVDSVPVAVLFDRYYPKSTMKDARKKPGARRRAIRQR